MQIIPENVYRYRGLIIQFLEGKEGESRVMVKRLFVLLLLLFSLKSFAVSSTYDATINGKKCKESTNQTLSCDYKIGNSLHISINGIGAPDTGVSFIKSDFDGDFYGTFAIGHGCIIVASGNNHGKGKEFFDYAFISPRNGKVYKDWKQCKSGY